MSETPSRTTTREREKPARANTRAAGHKLRSEGAAFAGGAARPQRVHLNGGTGGTGFALCSCGARSAVLDSGTKRRAWHAQHKAEVGRKGKEAKTLTEFLLARIAEDETQAREAVSDRDRLSFAQYTPDVPDMGFTAWLDAPVPAVLVGPERILAECEAKRLIVENYSPEMFDAEEYEKVLGWLAVPYADHPDYQQEWKP